MVGPQTSLTTERHIQSVCHSLQVPHLEARWSYPAASSWDRHQFTVNFYPSPPELSLVGTGRSGAEGRVKTGEK